MSWNFGVHDVPRADVHDAIRAASDAASENYEGGWSEAVQAQIACAIEAIDVLLTSVEGNHVSVNLGGHAKGEFENDVDTINVNVTGLNVPEPEPLPEPEEEA